MATQARSKALSRTYAASVPRQNRPKSTKKTRTTIPLPQSVRIIQRHIAGESIRQIAREEKRDRATITKIVRSEEMQEYVQKAREQYYGLGELALEGVRRALIQSNDGRLAHELLRNIGVIPTSGEVYTLQHQTQQVDATTEEDDVKREMWKMACAAYHRAQMFEQPLPSLEDIRVPEQMRRNERDGDAG